LHDLRRRDRFLEFVDFDGLFLEHLVVLEETPQHCQPVRGQIAKLFDARYSGSPQATATILWSLPVSIIVIKPIARATNVNAARLPDWTSVSGSSSSASVRGMNP
jgi:hypothetical protein